MLNMDFQQPVWVDTDQQAWIASPAKGVWRKPLERESDEYGHVTSVVKYSENSAFAAHPHPGGEEILVLEGVFSDENGDYPAGTYLRNPPGSHHAPFSQPGCLILVKLNQFNPDDLLPVCVDTLQAEWYSGLGQLHVMPLHQFDHETVSLIRWPKGEQFDPRHARGGVELFVLSGKLLDGESVYPARSWLRLPHQKIHALQAIEDAVVWLKSGHLPLLD